MICDAVLREKLRDLTPTLELCEESGHVLAVIPVTGSAVDTCEPQMSSEEWQRRMAQKGKTLTKAEVLAHLESL